jgi:hypothetical protein
MLLAGSHLLNARLESARATWVRRLAPAGTNPLICGAPAMARKLQSQNQYYAEVEWEAV